MVKQNREYLRLCSMVLVCFVWRIPDPVFVDMVFRKTTDRTFAFCDHNITIVLSDRFIKFWNTNLWSLIFRSVTHVPGRRNLCVLVLYAKCAAIGISRQSSNCVSQYNRHDIILLCPYSVFADRIPRSIRDNDIIWFSLLSSPDTLAISCIPYLLGDPSRKYRRVIILSFAYFSPYPPTEKIVID